MSFLRIIALFFLGCLVSLNSDAQSALTQRQFIYLLSSKNQIPAYYIKTVLDHARFVPISIKKITTPYEAEPYSIYITHFLTQERILKGADFWQAHQRILMLAQKKYGVSSYILTALLGIETVYGKKQGAIPVLNSLYTLSFYYPPRAHFFQEELGQYLIMCYEKRISPYTIRGSYAGAFGMPQFMPSSYRLYSVAYNSDHAPDIVHNTNDAIMSIANYLQQKGWRPHQTYQKELRVIMHYNTSIDYAMTAYQLANAIKMRVNRV